MRQLNAYWHLFDTACGTLPTWQKEPDSVASSVNMTLVMLHKSDRNLVSRRLDTQNQY